MGAEEPQEPAPSLEPPSLRPPSLFARRRKKASAPTAEPAETSEPGDTRVYEDLPGVFADTGSDQDTSNPEPARDVPAAASTRRFSRKKLSVPSTFAGPMPAPVGAAMVGLMTGIALLCLMWLGFRGCETISGTQSCGAGPGMAALVVVFGLTVVVGRLLLGLLKVPDAGMTSFLAVGVTSLIAVLVLNGLFDSALILVVLPLLSAAAFAGSWWLSTVQLDADD